MERMLKIRGFEIKLESLTEEENKKCDVIEEICLVDNRALRLIGWLLQKFGKDILVDGGLLDLFIISHEPNSADYNILSQWILSSKSIPVRKVIDGKTHIFNIIKEDDRNIKDIAYSIFEKIIKLDPSNPDIKYLNSILIYNSLDEVIKSGVKTIVIDKIVIDINESYAIIGIGKDIYKMNYDILKLIVTRTSDMVANYVVRMRFQQYNSHPMNIMNLGGNPYNNPQLYSTFNGFHSGICYPNPLTQPGNGYMNNNIPGYQASKKKENTNPDSIDVEEQILVKKKMNINKFAERILNKIKDSNTLEKERFSTFCNLLIKDNLMTSGMDLDGEVILFKDTAIIVCILDNEFKINIDDDNILLSLESIKKLIEKIIEMN